MEIFLVEDDAIQVFMMERCLAKTGLDIDVVTFENGKLAYDSLLERSQSGRAFPDLIFLDLNMPEWDGWDFYSEYIQLKESYQSLVYIVTSSNSCEDRSRAESYGILDRYILKPVQFDSIQQLMNSFLKSRSENSQ